MSRWRYWDDPNLRMGDVVMTTRNYRPSWLDRWLVLSKSEQCSAACRITRG